MAKVKINGREVFLPDSVTTAEEIRRVGDVRQGRNLIKRTREGNYLVPSGLKLTINDGDQFTDAPSRVKGA